MTLLMFGFVAQANAASILVQQDLTLKVDPQGGYWGGFHFLQDNPGVLTEDSLSLGCSLYVTSRKSVLKAGSFVVTETDETSPSVWDRRWWHSVGHRNGDVEVLISCKSGNRIRIAFINRVMTGYVSVKN